MEVYHRHALNYLLYLFEIDLAFIIYNIFVGFLRIIIQMNFINWLAFFFVEQCVYCQVRTDFVNI
jgi:hypothetical protein